MYPEGFPLWGPELYVGVGEGDLSVTLHVLLMTADRKGFVWASDQLAGTSAGYAMLEKVAYFSELGIAASIWGDSLAMFVRDAIVQEARMGRAPLGDKGAMKLFLQDVAAAVIREHKPQNLQTMPRGVILAVTGESPQLWQLTVHHPPMANPISSAASFGDEGNPALFFMHRYYELCDKTMPQAIAIAVHTARMAVLMNTKGIRGIDVWTCQQKEFRQLTVAEIAPYITLSDSIDDGIRSNFILDTSIAASIELQHDKEGT